MTLRLGVIGCGWAAGEIARAGVGMPTLAIAAACDADPVRAAAFAERTGACLHPDAAPLLADTAVDAVYASLPHVLLAPMAERALLAGKHVLAEKPLALDPAQALHLGRLAEARGLKLAVFFELRRAGTVTEAKRLIDAGEIGVPRLVRIRTVIDKRTDYWGTAAAPSWRARRDQAGGGVLLMNTIHQLDTLRYITGLDFASAQGDMATFHAPADVEDTGSATLRLSNGALVNVVASAHSPGARHGETIEIDGDHGRLDLPDPFGMDPLRLYRRSTHCWQDIPVERPDSHRLMLADFVRAAIEGTDVPASAADAAAAVGAVQAIYRSAAERRAVEIAAG